MIFCKENLYLDSISEKLSHLNLDDVVQLINDYYAGIRADILKEKYSLNVQSSRIVSLFPLIITNINCDLCNNSMVTKLKSKSSSERLSRSDLKCPACGHSDSISCDCSACLTNREHQRKAKEDAAQSLISKKNKYLEELQNTPPIFENDLGLVGKLYLSSILRVCLNEDANLICDVDKKIEIITPHQEFTAEVIQHLITLGAIVPSIDNDLKNIVEKDDGSIVYYMFRVKYRLNVESFDNWEDMLYRLVYPCADEFIKAPVFCFNFWKKIAFYESMQYLIYKMESVRYDFTPGPKTKMVFENLVNHFSVGQIYNIVYRAIANSTERYQSGTITKVHAQNMVIASCENQGEKAIANNWNLANYARIRELPQSQISKVLFDSILKISYLGFTEKPTSNF